ncbi:flavodoxin family protein [Variovorax saccharolyticus]|uniref:flavodoxin family protein n=1 Tax=Variovorax saccharolyticus TaxID=3053516 RepID=UPI0025750D2B|nr:MULTISPECIES: flavodoxin family protein [unclassified Variovorax]MDM0022313.1 flavodoxin family protein [Variovorax sp. J22R187]MDM0028869.1 flavodoxin family protein [Variovorax sp. J31P216]
MSSNVVIVYHSGYGHTAKIAEAVAAASGATLLAIDAEGQLPDGGWDVLDKASTIVFGTPTYMGNVSWQFKRFADASSAVWAKQGWKDKMAAAFTNSASVAGDKQTTLYTLFTLAQQHGMLWAGTGLMPSNAKTSTRDDINYLSSFVGLATASPSDASIDEIPAGDLATARLFGARLRELTARIA